MHCRIPNCQETLPTLIMSALGSLPKYPWHHYIIVVLVMGPKAQFRWTEAREEHYLRMLVDAMKEGQRAENGWKPQIYVDIAARMIGFIVITKA
jgi:hypothetical protein